MSHFSAHSKAHIPKTKTHFAKCGYPKMTRNDARAPRAHLGWGAQCAGPERRAEKRRCRQDAALKRGTQEPEARGSIHPKLCLQSGVWRSLLLSISAVTALPAHRPLPATLSYCSEQLRAASTTPGEAGISWGHPLIAPPSYLHPQEGWMPAGDRRCPPSSTPTPAASPSPTRRPRAVLAARGGPGVAPPPFPGALEPLLSLSLSLSPSPSPSSSLSPSPRACQGPPWGPTRRRAGSRPPAAPT